MFQSSVLIVLVAFAALVGAVNCATEEDLVVPLDCRASPAAVAPSVARKMCKELISLSKNSVDIEEAEDLASGCACGLRTHKIWYKALTTSVMVQSVNTIEKAYSSLLNDRYAKFSKGTKLSSLYDKLRLLTSEGQDFNDRISNKFWVLFVDRYYNMETGQAFPDTTDGPLKYRRVKEVARNSCYHLLHNPLFSELIEPSLEAISSTMGKRADYGIVSSEPDLALVMNFAHLCRAFIGEQQDNHNDY